jgi:hypothetical protein
MAVQQRDQPIEKRRGRAIHDQVVGEDADRRGRIGSVKPARPQMADKAAERGSLANKPAILMPRDQVDVDIDQDHSWQREIDEFSDAILNDQPIRVGAAIPFAESSGTNRRRSGSTAAPAPAGARPEQRLGRARPAPISAATTGADRPSGYSLFLPYAAVSVAPPAAAN